MTPTCLEAWNLKSNPFGHSGVKLEPKARATDLPYYFDFYEWVDTASLSGLTDAGRVKLGALPAGAMMTLLISGVQGCGRSSLINLLLYELDQLGQQAAKPPIIVEFTLEPSASGVQRVLSLAREIADVVELEHDVAGAGMHALITRWKDDASVAGGEPNSDNLFLGMRKRLSAALPGRPLIVSIDALSHTLSRDTATAARTMLQNLADVVILALTSVDDARWIRTACIHRGAAVALIDAPKVDLAKGRALLTRCLAKERKGARAGEGPLFPFTDEALEVLFAPAPGAAPTESLSIALALKRVTGVMASKCAGCAGAGSLHPITAADMRAYLGV